MNDNLRESYKLSILNFKKNEHLPEKALLKLSR